MVGNIWFQLGRDLSKKWSKLLGGHKNSNNLLAIIDLSPAHVIDGKTRGNMLLRCLMIPHANMLGHKINKKIKYANMHLSTMRNII